MWKPSGWLAELHGVLLKYVKRSGANPCLLSYDSEMSRSPVGKMTSTCSKSLLPKPSLQLSTQCRRPVWEHWKIFQGWGLTQERAKKPSILFAVCQHKALLFLFLKCCIFSCHHQSRDGKTQATRTGKLRESDFFHSGEDLLSKKLGMSGLLATNQLSLIWKATL